MKILGGRSLLDNIITNYFQFVRTYTFQTGVSVRCPESIAIFNFCGDADMACMSVLSQSMSMMCSQVTDLLFHCANVLSMSC